MAKSFIDELTQLQNQNLFGGLVKEATANLMEQRTKTTSDILTNLNAGLLALDSSVPSTTDEQLANLNNDPTAKKELSSLTDIAAKYQTLSQNITARQEDYANLYDAALTNLGIVGGEEAERVSEILGKRKTQKMQFLQSKIENFQNTLKTEKMLYDIQSAQYDIEKTKLEVEKYKQDQTVANMTAKILSFDDPDTNEKTKMDFKTLTPYLVFNTNTGRTRYTSDMINTYRDKVWEAFGKDDPDSFAKAWVIVETKIRDSVKNYDPPTPKGDTTTAQTIYGWLTNVKDRRNILKSYTDKYGYYTVKDGKWVKDAYMTTAQALNKKGDPFSSSEVIDSMTGNAKEIAQELNDVFYNTSNKDYYWKYMNELKGLLSPTGSKFRMPTDLGTEGITPLIDGDVIRWQDLILNEEAVIEKDKNGKEVPKGIGWWNPYDPERFIEYSQIRDNMTKAILNSGKAKTKNAAVQSQLNTSSDITSLRGM